MQEPWCACHCTRSSLQQQQEAEEAIAFFVLQPPTMPPGFDGTLPGPGAYFQTEPCLSLPVPEERPETPPGFPSTAAWPPGALPVLQEEASPAARFEEEPVAVTLFKDMSPGSPEPWVGRVSGTRPAAQPLPGADAACGGEAAADCLHSGQCAATLPGGRASEASCGPDDAPAASSCVGPKPEASQPAVAAGASAASARASAAAQLLQPPGLRRSRTKAAGVPRWAGCAAGVVVLATEAALGGCCALGLVSPPAAGACGSVLCAAGVGALGLRWQL
mmetsp:Transcript_59904/g.185682  ORF Transcript_59904/g.185682 Transcript_59904/m.185682 type:complete len:276 (-) Transcript_59904:141-968(-)